MKRTTIQFLFAAVMVAATVSSPAQSSFSDLMDTASATMDAARESREQNAAETDVRAIFAKAKAAADARTLAGYYGLKDGEWTIEGDPVYEIHLSLKGVRRVTKGGNTFDELAQAVANRVGSLKQNWETKVYYLQTIDGISVTMSSSSGFTMFDADLKTVDERKASLAWKGESKSIPISDSVSIHLRSVPGNLWFGLYEVTQAQWEAVMGENPSRFKGEGNPVDSVSWDDCQKFLRKLNALPAVKTYGLTFRLPTDKEWERACRAGATGDYCLLADGTEITKDTLGEVVWFEDNSDRKTHPVGQKQPNAFGLYDMHGNVSEWCQEEYGAVMSWAKGKDYEHDRVFRGGGWGNSTSLCESSTQLRYSPSNRGRDLGFRLCASGRAE